MRRSQPATEIQRLDAALQRLTNELRETTDLDLRIEILGLIDLHLDDRLDQAATPH